MNPADFNQLEGFVDYDRPYLNSLNKRQRIEYFIRRINRILKRPLAEIYLSFMKKKPDSTPVLCFAICICCSIEAFGRFINGNKGQSARFHFETFVKDYMHSDYINKDFHGKKYVDLLRDNFRNGLAHGFTIMHGGLEHNKKEYFFIKRIGSADVLEIDPTHLYKDFLRAIKKYTNHLRKSRKTDPIYKNFNKAFEDIFIKGK